MKRCSARPYEGPEPYIFVSYCHKDKPQVFPIIERLARDGYRVWYDEGIDPGTEWPEIIAQHLNGCRLCIAFLSGNALDSHNCRREINFALLKKKPFLSVVLEPVALSLGIEMQLSATQSILKYEISSEAEFFRILYSAPPLAGCLGLPNLDIHISTPADYYREAPSQLRRESFSDRWFKSDGAGGQGEKEEAQRRQQEEQRRREEAQRRQQEEQHRREEEQHRQLEEQRKKEAEQRRLLEEQRKKEAELLRQEEQRKQEQQRKREEAQRRQAEKKKQDPSEKPTVLLAQPFLRRLKTGEEFFLDEGETILGRSETKAHFKIVDNDTVGRVHARVFNRMGQCFIEDNHSKNGTFLNGQRLEPERKYPLVHGDDLRLANEKLMFFQRKD